jgi:hypothetical protein
VDRRRIRRAVGRDEFDVSVLDAASGEGKDEEDDRGGA